MALILFARRNQNFERKFRVPLYPLTPILGIGMNLFLIVNLAVSDRPALIIAVSVIGAGVLYYYLYHAKVEICIKGNFNRRCAGD